MVSNIRCQLTYRGQSNKQKSNEVSSNSLTTLHYKIGDVCFQKVKKKE